VYDQTVLASGRSSASLVVRQGAQVGKTFPLTDDVVVVGREEGAGVSIHDPEVSRRHARISWQAGRYILEDLGSTNGTYLNDERVTTPQSLQPGDTIGMGQTVLIFQVQAEVVPTQPEAAPIPILPEARAQPELPPSPPPTAEPVPQESGRSRCLLVGCSCLVLLGLFLAVVAVALMLLADQIQPIFEDLGIPIQLALLYFEEALAFS
jgi:hypothetical protein